MESTLGSYLSEEHKQKKREYYQKNKEVIKEKVRKYLQAKKEKAKSDGPPVYKYSNETKIEHFN